MAFRFNPFSGNLDWVLSDAEVQKIACEKAIEVVQSIPTSNTNPLGNTNFYYDPVACAWVEAPFTPVTDEDGNIIVEVDP